VNSITDQLLVLVVLINILILGTHRTRVAIRAIALQGIVLGFMPLLINSAQSHALLITLFVLLAKGICIPWLLFGAMRKVDFGEDVEPFLGYAGNIIAGAVVTVLAFLFAGRLPLAPLHEGLLTVPAALATSLPVSLPWPAGARPSTR
jgi:hydrogenase-4 component E